MQLLEAHVQELETEISHIIARSREGRVVLSIPAIGPIQAAIIIAAIGHIDSFPSAALKAYFGWAPKIARSGVTMDRAALTRGGMRTVKHIMFLVVCQAIRTDCEWARLYARLVPRKCAYDERTKTYKGKVVSRVARQIITTIFALLKQDAELLSRCASGRMPPEPIIYDAAVHRAHREGRYQPVKREPPLGTITVLPQRESRGGEQ